MILRELRGKKANKNRWEALKMLDWEKDYDVIEKIFSVTNPIFFSKRTPKQIISEIKEEIKFNALIKGGKEE